MTCPCHVPTKWQHIWTDGSALNNSSLYCTAGSAWASPCSLSQTYHLIGPLLSNNIAELCTVYMALQAWQNCTLHIHTDFTYMLDLVKGSLLAMEQDRWHGHPPYSCTPNNIGFVIPALGAVMMYDSFTFGSLRPLFQALLFAIQAHSSCIKFTWTQAHTNDEMNNCIDHLAKQGLLPNSPPCTSQTYLPPLAGLITAQSLTTNPWLSLLTQWSPHLLPPFTAPNSPPFSPPGHLG